MKSKELQEVKLMEKSGLRSFLNKSSQDLDILKPVNPSPRPQLSHILVKVEELKQQFQYKQLNDPRYIKMVPIINLGDYAKLEESLQTSLDKQVQVLQKPRPKLNPIQKPKSRNQRILNFLVASGSCQTNTNLVSDLVSDEQQRRDIQKRMQSNKLINQYPKKVTNNIGKIPVVKTASRSKSYNMVHVRHCEHKYNSGTTSRGFLKKGARVTGAIIDKLASEDQRRNINFNKNIFFQKHNQAMPEDGAIWWDQKLINFLDIMKGTKERKAEKRQVDKRDSQYEFREFNLDDEFAKGEI